MLIQYLICIASLNFLNCLNASVNLDRTNRFAVKFNNTFTEKLKQTLQEHSFSWLFEVTPETCVIEYIGSGRGSEILQALSNIEQTEIISWEPVRVYANDLKPADVNATFPVLLQPNVVCEKYYGMSVEETWQLGYTGKNVVIAITDVGINTDLLDLRNNIRLDLSKNFLENSDNVAPEQFPDTFLNAEAALFTDHGNRVASVVAAEKGNNVCSAGIAFNASIAVLKIYEVQLQSYTFKLKPGHWTAADTVSRAFMHNLDKIHVFVNAWSPTRSFDKLDLLTSEALKFGATQGRSGLGTIYGVPAGPTGNGLSNNIFTVTVGGVGQFGSVPPYVGVDPSAITCGLYNGNNITASSMVTISHDNKCISSFGGLSAATAQLAGIIDQGLEANPQLSQRDILHLLVESSEHYRLTMESRLFKKNGAGIFFHPILGFGLVNSLKFVSLAKNGISTPKLLTATLSSATTRRSEDKIMYVAICFDCSYVQVGEQCITRIEQVHVSIKIKIDTSNLTVALISPRNTESILMDDVLDQDQQNVIIDGAFVSVHFWNEVPFGVWKVKIQQNLNAGSVEVEDLKITFHGTNRLEEIHFVDLNFCNEEPLVKASEVPDLKGQTDIQCKVSTECENILPMLGPFCAVVLLLIFVSVKRSPILCSCNSTSTRRQKF